MAEEVVWSYKGGADGSEEAKQRGEQRAMAGMLCFEDAMGECKLVGKEGDDLLCAFHEAGATVERTCVAASRARRWHSRTSR